MVPDSHDELELESKALPGSELAAVRRVWDVLDAQGVVAAMEELMTFSHPDIELRSYSARGAARPGEEVREEMHGREEILDFFRRTAQDGVTIHARARSFEIEGEAVVVSGSARVARGDGSFAETKLRWLFRFRDGLVCSVNWEPRAGG